MDEFKDLDLIHSLTLSDDLSDMARTIRRYLEVHYSYEIEADHIDEFCEEVRGFCTRIRKERDGHG